jgi:type VI protein secretion system component VasA
MAERMMKTFTNVQLKAPDPVILPAVDAIKPVGFRERESIFHIQTLFRRIPLLSEYFAFPYKFLFFDIHGLDIAGGKNSAAISISSYGSKTLLLRSPR